MKEEEIYDQSGNSGAEENNSLCLSTPGAEAAGRRRLRAGKMQKKEQSKVVATSTAAVATSAAKRGRPVGSTAAAAAAAAAVAAETLAPSTVLGPSLQLHSSFADQYNKRIVLALQSGLKSELIWALNALTLLSFKEKDEMRRDATPLAKIPGLLDALLQIVDDWRDIAMPRDPSKPSRFRSLGSNSAVTGFGNEFETMASSTSSLQQCTKKASISKNSSRCPPDWWYEEEGLFNVDEDGRSEKQQCAVAASNIIRNFSFMPENEAVMAQHRHCLETLFQCIEDHVTEDEELVTNALETIANLAPSLILRIFRSSKPSYIKMTEERAAKAIVGMLNSVIKTWHCVAAELLGRLVINPDNEAFLLPFASQMYKRLIDLVSFSALDAQAAAVSALYNLVEVSMDCKLKLASERWAIDRLLKVIRTPHPVPEVCRKAATILENLLSEPQNKALLLPFEHIFAEIAFSDARSSDTFARILFELTSRPGTKVVAARNIWGMS